MLNLFFFFIKFLEYFGYRLLLLRNSFHYGLQLRSMRHGISIHANHMCIEKYTFLHSTCVQCRKLSMTFFAEPTALAIHNVAQTRMHTPPKYRFRVISLPESPIEKKKI